MGKDGFKGLKVWEKAKNLAIDIYKVTNDKNFKHDLALRDQMRKSAVSVASNIAEGDERDTDKERVRFLYIAKGSLAELRTQLEIAHSIGYINLETYDNLENKLLELSKMIGSLIKYRVINRDKAK